jgi:hypothetical protein
MHALVLEVFVDAADPEVVDSVRLIVIYSDPHAQKRMDIHMQLPRDFFVHQNFHGINCRGPIEETTGQELEIKYFMKVSANAHHIPCIFCSTQVWNCHLVRQGRIPFSPGQVIAECRDRKIGDPRQFVSKYFQLINGSDVAVPDGENLIAGFVQVVIDHIPHLPDDHDVWNFSAHRASGMIFLPSACFSFSPAKKKNQSGARSFFVRINFNVKNPFFSINT